MAIRKLKKLPPLRTDEEAEEFLENEDLSEYDWSGFKRVQFIFTLDSKRIEALPSENLIDSSFLFSVNHSA